MRSTAFSASSRTQDLNGDRHDGQNEVERPDHPASLDDSSAASHPDEVFGMHKRIAFNGRGYREILEDLERGEIWSTAAMSFAEVQALLGGPYNVVFRASQKDQLLRDPFCGRMSGYFQPKKFPTGMLQNQNAIRQPERNCRHHK
jgi:hypothetical protein